MHTIQEHRLSRGKHPLLQIVDHRQEENTLRVKQITTCAIYLSNVCLGAGAMIIGTTRLDVAEQMGTNVTGVS